MKVYAPARLRAFLFSYKSAPTNFIWYSTVKKRVSFILPLTLQFINFTLKSRRHDDDKADDKKMCLVATIILYHYHICLLRDKVQYRLTTWMSQIFLKTIRFRSNITKKISKLIQFRHHFLLNNIKIMED